MFDLGRDGDGGSGDGGSGGGRTPGQLLADQIVARDARIRDEEVGTVLDLKAWLDLHSVDESDPLAHGVAGGAGKRSGSAGTPMVDEFAVREYAALRHQSESTARAFMIDVADLEHRFPKLWAAMLALAVPVWQARKVAAACRDLSPAAAALVDAELAPAAPGLPWGRILTLLDAAIMTADPVAAETKRQQAKQARFVALSLSVDCRTLVVRAEDGDLLMVYALVDRLADILALEGSTDPADQRRATAFGLLAQPALVLQLLLRHAHDGRHPATGDRAGDDTDEASSDRSSSGAGADPAGPRTPDAEPTPDLFGDTPADPDDPDPDDPDPDDAEPPPWTAEDYAEPPDPAPVDHPNIPDFWQQRLRPRPAPESPAPVWTHDPLDDPDPGPPDPAEPRDTARPRYGSGLWLDLPGLEDLLTEQGLKPARPRVVLNVHLTDQTLATGRGVVRTDGCGPLLAAQLREFLIKHGCHITVRPILDPDQIPAVDAYEIPDRIRRAVRTRQVASVFPYSGATGPGLDLDHTVPYRWDGTPGQTGPITLGPLSRGEHNARTHGRWTVTSPHPGVFLWRSPHGQYFLVTNQGTQHLGPLPITLTQDGACPWRIREHA